MLMLSRGVVMLALQKAPPVTCFHISVSEEGRRLPENKNEEMSDRLEKSNARIRIGTSACR